MTPSPLSSAWTENECQQCGIIFSVRLSNVKRGRGKYCSRPCLKMAVRARSTRLEYGGDVFYLNWRGYYESLKTGRFLHRVIWEERYGPVPAGHKIYHRDRVRSNYQLENLYLRELNPQSGCREEGCESEIYARELCKKHYMSMRAKERRRERRAVKHSD